MFLTSGGMATSRRAVEAMQRTTCSFRSGRELFAGRRAVAKVLLRQSLVAMADEGRLPGQLVAVGLAVDES